MKFEINCIMICKFLKFLVTSNVLQFVNSEVVQNGKLCVKFQIKIVNLIVEKFIKDFQ